MEQDPPQQPIQHAPQPLPQQFADEYVLHHQLGHGGQADVYAGSKDFQLYAIKVFFPGARKEADYQSQARILNHLKFPHLINIVDHRPRALIKLKNRPEQRRPIIVEQLADGFVLYEYIARLGKFAPFIARYYAKQLVATVKYLVDQNITHRDIKPFNILLDCQFNIKLSDFGLSRDSTGDLGDYKLRSRVGTQGYRPPEMQAGNYLGIQSDMFATGVVLFNMFTGTTPFFSCKPHDRIYGHIKQSNYQRFWELQEKNKPAGFYPIPFKRLMNSFFSADPAKRPTFQSLQNDQWWNMEILPPPNLPAPPIQNQVYAYMRARYQTLYQHSPVQDVRRQLLRQRVEAEKCKGMLQQQKELSRGAERYRESEETLTNFSIDERFVKTCLNLQIQLSELPQFSKTRIQYFKQNPSFVVAWVKDFLEKQFLNKQVFLKQFVGQMIPKQFIFSYMIKNCQIELNFMFELNVENDINDVQLNLFGQLHRSEKGEVGVQWRKGVGNFFWLQAIQSRLNEGLKGLNRKIQ